MLDWSLARRFTVELEWKRELMPVELQFVPLKAEIGEPRSARLLLTPQGDETRWVLRRFYDGGRAKYQRGYGYNTTFPWELTDEQLVSDLKSALSNQLDRPFEFKRCFEVPHRDGKKTYHIALRENGWRNMPLIMSESDGTSLFEELLIPPVGHEEFLSWTNGQIENWIDSQYKDPNSELRFSLWFNQLPKQQAMDFVESHIAGCRELKQFMHWVMILNPELFEGAAEWILEHGLLYLNPWPRIVSTVDHSPFLAKLSEFLIARFLPLPALKILLPPYEHIIPIRVESIVDIVTNLKVVVVAPSAHERLEAGLQLQEWLKQNVTPQEFAAIWGEIQSNL